MSCSLLALNYIYIPPQGEVDGLTSNIYVTIGSKLARSWKKTILDHQSLNIQPCVYSNLHQTLLVVSQRQLTLLVPPRSLRRGSTSHPVSLIPGKKCRRDGSTVLTLMTLCPILGLRYVKGPEPKNAENVPEVDKIVLKMRKMFRTRQVLIVTCCK